jgi:HlyD family secretion protein
MKTNSPPLSPNLTESVSVNPSRVLETDLMSTESTRIVQSVTGDMVPSVAYPVVPTHVVHVSTELMPGTAFPLQRVPQRTSLAWLPLVITALLTVGVCYLFFRPLPSVVSISQEGGIPVVRATKAPLANVMQEQGVLESSDTVALTNPVSAAAVTITSMTPYGTLVKKGDIVAKLGLAPLHSAIADQQSKILAARMKVTDTQEALEALKAKNDSEAATAELNLEFAQIDLTKYQNEEKQVELADRRGQISMAERDLKEAEEKFQYYRTFHKRGFISSEQLKAKEAELDRSRFNLAQSQSRLKIFERYMVPRQERTLQVKVDELRRDLQKLKKGHCAAITKAKADIVMAQAALTGEEQKLTALQGQLTCTELKAPRDGILAAPPAEAQKSRPAIGATIQPSQVIFTMPVMSSTYVRVRLSEADARKLHLNQATRIHLDGDDAESCVGCIEKIEFQAESFWAKTDTHISRDYVAHIKLLSSHPLDWSLLGQKARVEFTMETLPDALQVPANAITEKDGRSYVTVLTSDGPTQRELRTGCTDGKHVEVRQGLEPGDRVLLGKVRHDYDRMQLTP